MIKVNRTTKVFVFIFSIFFSMKSLGDWVWDNQISIVSNPALSSSAHSGFTLQKDSAAILLISGPSSKPNALLQAIEYQNGKWSDAYTIARGSIEVIQTFKNNSGELEVIWVDKDTVTPSLMFSKYATNGISETYKIYENLSLSTSDIQAKKDNNGNIYVVWSLTSEINTFSAYEVHRISGVWSTVYPVMSLNERPTICSIFDFAVLVDGDFSISFRCNGKSRVVLFKAGTKALEESFDGIETLIAYDGDSILHRVSSGGNEVHTSTFKDGKWQPEIQFDDVPASANSFCSKQMDVSPSGAIYMTWINQKIVQSKSYSSGSWKGTINISDPLNPDLAHYCVRKKSASGKLYILWNTSTAQQGGAGLYYTYAQENRWHSPLLIGEHDDFTGNLFAFNDLDPDAIALSTNYFGDQDSMSALVKAYRLREDSINDYGFVKGFNFPNSERSYSLFLFGTGTILAWGNVYEYNTNRSYVISNKADMNQRKSYDLSIKRIGAGQGFISSQPKGINCGMSCLKSYPDGTTVSLFAKPSDGFIFAGWSGDCAGKQDCQTIMTENRNVSAKFEAAPASIARVIPTNNGVVSSEPAGILCGGPNKQCSSSFTSAKLTATPNPGYEFIKWNGCQAPEGNICYIKPTGKMTVSAVFKVLPKYNVKIAKNTLGSITSTPGGLNCPDKKKSCSVKFIKGTAVTLTPLPQAGRTFVGWSGACSGTAPCSLLIDGNKGIGATFQ